MSFPNGDSINANVYAYPSGFFDRYPFPDDDGFWGYTDRTEWESYTLDRHDNGAPCDVSVQYIFNPSTRALTATVQTNFYGDFNDNFRFNLFLTEDSVSEGTGSQWDQHNYYSSQSSAYGGPSHPYYTLPDPIIGYQHRHVCRAMLGGPWGSPGSIPSSVTDGSSYTTSYNYTIPSNWDTSKIVLIGMVMRYDPDYQQRYIYNSVMVPLVNPTGIASGESNSSIELYPNPGKEIFHLNITTATAGQIGWKIYDLSGALVSERNPEQVSMGIHYNAIDASRLPSGIYFVDVNVNGEHHVIKMVVTD
jgi:hypothetical protein